jgi:hypothetical protein
MYTLLAQNVMHKLAAETRSFAVKFFPCLIVKLRQFISVCRVQNPLLVCIAVLFSMVVAYVFAVKIKF